MLSTYRTRALPARRVRTTLHSIAQAGVISVIRWVAQIHSVWFSLKKNHNSDRWTAGMKPKMLCHASTCSDAIS
jgi:hypothetical protein